MQMKGLRLAKVDTLLPSQEDAYNDLEAVRAKISKAQVCVRPSASYASLDNDSDSRLRWRPRILRMYEHFTTERAICLSGWWLMLGPAIRREINLVLVRMGLMTKQLEKHEERIYLSELGDIYKKHQTNLSANWMQFVDLHLLTDYEKLNKKELDKDVKEWISGKIEHSINGDTKKFNDYFRFGVQTFLRASVGQEAEEISLEQFASDPMYYARTGTSDGDRLMMKTKGREGSVTKAKRSKWSAFLTMTHNQIKDILTGKTHRVQHGKAFAKRERGKIRPIVAGDDANYLRESYVSTWLEPKLYAHPYTPLFYSSQQLFNMFTEMARDTKDVRNPIDQKEFDHRVTMEMLQITYQEIEQYIETYCFWQSKESLLKTMDTLIELLPTGTVTLVLGGETPIRKGVMSGRRWTALLDTIINAAEVLMFCKLTEEYGIPQPLKEFKSFGDDIHTRANDYGRAIIFNLHYQRADFLINDKKTFMSPIKPGEPTVDEFLRNVCTEGKVLGYPARAVGSLIFRNPVNQEPERGTARVREMMQNWNTVISRLRRHANERMESIYTQDISKSNHISEQEVEIMLHTPSYLGGCGLTPTVYKGLITEREPTEVHWGYNSLPKLSFGKLHEPEDVAQLWLSNLQSNRSVKKTYYDYTIKEVIDDIPAYKNVNYLLNAPDLSIIRYRRDITLTDIELYKRDINRCHKNTEVLEITRKCVDPNFIPTVDDMSKRMSIKVFKMWLTGKLPKGVPIILGKGSLIVSVLYERLWNSFFYSRTTGRKLNYKIMLKIAKSAEVHTHNLVQQYGEYTG